MRGLGLIGLMLLSSVAVAADASDVRNLMTPEEFRAAGLEKLDAAEIAALNAWLRTRIQAPVDMDQPQLEQRDSGTARYTDAGEPMQIVSTLVGDFSGWDGETRFHLANGQVWQQRVANKRYRYTGAQPVEVEIARNVFGFYVLKIKSTGRKIGVKRLY